MIQPPLSFIYFFVGPRQGQKGPWEGQMPLVAAEKMWERTIVGQFNDTEYLMKGALYVVRKGGV